MIRDGFPGHASPTHHETLLPTQSSGDVERDQHHAAARPAFVLLIIFIITTPLLEQGMTLKLPTKGGKPDGPISKPNIRTVEISPQGVFCST